MVYLENEILHIYDWEDSCAIDHEDESILGQTAATLWLNRNSDDIECQNRCGGWVNFRPYYSPDSHEGIFNLPG